MITIAGFVIDAVLRETHVYESDVTEYPVESGSMITDNIRPRPITVSIEGIVSDTPLPGPALTARGAVDADGKLEHVPSDDALAALKAIYDAREPVPIETSLKRYENMAMTSLEIPRDAETGHALAFTASFQQVQFVTNNRATIKVAPPANTGLGAKNNLGNKTTYDLRHGAVIWHHSKPEPLWSTSEVLGYNRQDAQTKGTSGFYHPNGTALTQDELDQFNADEKLWYSSHTDTGELLPQQTQTIFDNQSVVDSHGGDRFNGAVFQSSDGQWLDASGKPVTYNPIFGNWIESDPL